MEDFAHINLGLWRAQIEDQLYIPLHSSLFDALLKF